MQNTQSRLLWLWDAWASFRGHRRTALATWHGGFRLIQFPLAARYFSLWFQNLNLYLHILKNTSFICQWDVSVVGTRLVASDKFSILAAVTLLKDSYKWVQLPTPPQLLEAQGGFAV